MEVRELLPREQVEAFARPHQAHVDLVQATLASELQAHFPVTRLRTSKNAKGCEAMPARIER